MTDPWTLYWNSNNLQSCVPTAGCARVPAAERLWATFAASLPRPASVLDLATGNGIVPLQLLSARPDLDITAADRAGIDPLHNLDNADSLAGVHFLAGVDLADPATQLGRFDAVTSQFGIEYLPVDARVSAVVRHLVPGGRFCLLMHHSGSAIVQPRQADIEELDLLLGTSGPAAAAARFARQELDAAELETLTFKYMNADLRRTRRLSGQIVQGIDRLLRVFEKGNGYTARQLAGELERRAHAERERLQQLEAAALDADSAAAFEAALKTGGLRCNPHTVLHDDTATGEAGERPRQAILGWMFEGVLPV